MKKSMMRRFAEICLVFRLIVTQGQEKYAISLKRGYKMNDKKVDYQTIRKKLANMTFSLYQSRLMHTSYYKFQ